MLRNRQSSCMPGPAVSLRRLQQRLETLGTIGRDPHGGVTRLPFSPAHDEAVRLCAAWMKEAGLAPGVDEFGNLLGLASGDRPVLIAGSHLDSVPQGGMFDGALGVVAAIECAQALTDSGRALHRPFAAVAFADEEGYAFSVGTLSSRALVGRIPRSRFAELRDHNGVSLADHLRARAHALPPAKLPPRVRTYLELHAEQGPALEANGRMVAAVEMIVGMARTRAVFEGEAGHAGTTPMDRRADALIGAAELTLFIRELAARSEGRAVGTVGQLEVSPGAMNVIPGRVRMAVELRSADDGFLTDAKQAVERKGHEVARRYRLTFSAERWSESACQPLDNGVRKTILEAMKARGHPRQTLPSWAGHDAGVLAQYVPAGMIFVTSTGGISHSPREHTPWPAVEAGAQVLLDTLLLLDAAEDRVGTLPLAYSAR